MDRTPPPDGRAQTTLDFAIAMGVFLLAVAFVFTFIPSLTAPFIDGNQEQSAIADRVASHLVEGSLADPDEPYVLDVTCTTGFFNATNGTATDHCGYTNDTTDFQDRIGVTPRTHVNVTLVRVNATSREVTPLCYDNDNDHLVNTSHADCDPASDVRYRVGGSYANAESVTVARRVVSIDGRDATLLVRVW
jgi:hypothetical protein